ncbi:MAG: transposase [Bacteroidota bacterium]
MKNDIQSGTQAARKHYPSDITREDFAKVAPLLEQARKQTKPRKLDLYDIFCGVLYVIKNDVSWRKLPNDYPRWETCYAYFRKWKEVPKGHKESTLDKALSELA